MTQTIHSTTRDGASAEQAAPDGGAIQETAMNAVAHLHPVEVPAPITPLEMLHQAVSRGADIAVLEKLMGLQERWEANQARKAFDAAVAEAKGEIPPIVKDRQVGFESRRTGGSTSYTHESLGQIASIVDPILHRYGLSYRFKAEQGPAGVTVTCILSHRCGYAEETTLSAGADTSGQKNSIQAIGSTTTYLQRYTLKLALGLSTTDRDDDGGASTEPVLSAAAEAAINALNRLEETSALEKWRAQNDDMIKSLGRDDFTAVRRAYQSRFASLEIGQ